MKIISLFETITHVSAKDCIDGDSRMVFIVPENQIARAIGKKGANIRKLEKMLNRKIKIVEFNSNLIQFIRNLVYPVKIKDAKEENKVVTLVAEDLTGRGMLIGRNAQNLRNLEAMSRRYFDLKEIKVK